MQQRARSRERVGTRIASTVLTFVATYLRLGDPQSALLRALMGGECEGPPHLPIRALDKRARSEQYAPVTSWRDSASQEAQDDLDGLLNAALPFAQQMLGERGEFLPYGVVLPSGGEVRMIAADTDQGNTPRSADVLATLVQGVRGEREGLRAAALVSDVRAGDADAVRVELEHREGAAMAVLLPYKKKRLRKAVEYGGLVASVASPTIWQ